MSAPLDGRTIALAETRQLEELAAMIVREGGTPLRIPLVAILDTDQPAPVTGWLADLIADRFAYCVFMTGEGIRRLVTAADRDGNRDAAIAALGRTRAITRGPKPAAALKEIGLKPYKAAAAPTTDGLITTLSGEDLTGQTVGVQFHGHDNPPLIAAIEAAGATAVPVSPYRYAPAADADKVVDLIEKMAAGSVDLLVITSSPQVDRLYAVAKEQGLDEKLAAGVKKTAIAAVGPVAADTLIQNGARVDICPDHGWVMKKLVQLVTRELDAKMPK